MSKFISVMLISLLTFVLAAIGTFFYLFTPTYSSNLYFQDEGININRDEFGIPHIQAPTRRAFLYAWGTVIAEDRLFQCSFLRTFAEGALSQFLGESTLAVDINMRDLSLEKLADSAVKKMKEEDPNAYQDLLAYSQGINDEVAQRIILPLEFYVLGMKWKPWTVQSSFLLVKLIQWSISQNIVEEYIYSSLLVNHTLQEVQKLLPNTQEQWAFKSVTTVKDEDLPKQFTNYQGSSLTDLFVPIQIDKIIELSLASLPVSIDGSNAWAVSGNHTVSGKPILSSDPHLQPRLPSHWHQIRATYFHQGRKIQFSTAAMPGLFFGFGKSDYLAIGVTVLYTDTQDLYQEQIEGTNYLLNGQWKPLATRNETIRIKKDGAIKQHHHLVRFTHRGPLLHYLITRYGSFDLRGQNLSLRWTGYHPEYRSLVQVMRCQEITNIQSLTTFLRDHTSFLMSLNLIVATKDNHILYRQAGLNPIRRRVSSGTFVKNGTTSEDDWVGYIPAEDQLLVIDPQSGFIVSSNNKAASSNVHAGYFHHNIYTARADRLEEALSNYIQAGTKISTEIARTLLFDTIDIYCRQILPEITSVIAQASIQLHGFACDFKSQSFQATIYEVFMFELWLMIRPRTNFNASIIALGSCQQALYNYIHEAHQGDKPKQQTMAQAWTKMVSRLSGHFKTSEKKEWVWGLFHRDQMKQFPLGEHEVLGRLYNRETAGWGNLHTPNVGMANKMELGSFKTTYRANYRAIYDLCGPSFWIIDSGSSQNLLSRISCCDLAHYDDQWSLFIEEKLIRIELDQQSAEL